MPPCRSYLGSCKSVIGANKFLEEEVVEGGGRRNDVPSTVAEWKDKKFFVRRDG